MYKIPFDATRKSLYHPGEAVNFFQFGSAQTETYDALCAEMARLAYVKDEDQLKKYLDRAEFDLHCLIGYGDKGTQLFIAKTRPDTDTAHPPLVVVAFRGTEPDDPSDLVADAVLIKSAWFDASGKPLGQVHKGFADALLDDPYNGNILAHINSQLEELADQTPSILLTGHSLGAALATLTASCLNKAPLAEKIHAYTFGSPRVGDSIFSEQIPLNKHDRYVNCCDLVTRVPTEALDFLHGGTLHYIDRHGCVNDTITESAITEDRLKAAESYLAEYSCLRGTVWVRELADHSPINYLSGVAGLRA
ncbi:MAG: lipase family protein [Methylococcaceae bacterium]